MRSGHGGRSRLLRNTSGRDGTRFRRFREEIKTAVTLGVIPKDTGGSVCRR